MDAYHPKTAAALWLVLMLVITLLGSQVLGKDWLETRFLALFPVSEQSPAVANAIQQHNQQRDQNMVFLIGAANSQIAISQAKYLKQQLKQGNLFKTLLLELPQETVSKPYQGLFPYRYQLLDKQTRQLLGNKPSALLSQNLQTLSSPLGQMAAANLEKDPLLLFSRYIDKQNPAISAVEQGIAILHDETGYWAVLLAKLEDSHLQLDKLEALLAQVNKTRQQIESSGNKLLVTGMALFTAQGAESAKQEISTVGLGSSIGIVILILLTFRSIRPLLLSFLAISSGLFAALVISVITFGKIHIITLVFGASLIGVADDYALHYMCDSFGDKKWQPLHSLRYLMPGLLIGLLVNLLSYVGLILSPFPGLQEVAVFSAFGLLFAWLTVVMLFPLLVRCLDSSHQPLILKFADYWQTHWPVWLLNNKHWLMVFLVIFITSGLIRLSPNDDVRLLQSAPAELINTAEEVKKLLPISQDNQFFLVSGSTLNEWHNNEQRLLNELAALTGQGKLMGFAGLSDYWPNENNQQANYQLLDKALYQSGLLKQYMAGLGFSDKSIAGEYQAFAETKGRMISLPEWLKTTDETKRSLWLGCAEGSCRSLVTLTGIRDLATLSGLQKSPNVIWVDQVDQMSSLFARYRIRASLLLTASFLFVLIGLGFKFGWNNALVITSVPAISVMMALAMIGWFSQLFSLFNLFALLLVLGIGIDDAVFFYMADKVGRQSGNKAESKRTSTSLAVTLSAMTTLLAFGLLAVSSTEIVHAFGFTVATGIFTALCCSPLVGYRKGLIEFK